MQRASSVGIQLRNEVSRISGLALNTKFRGRRRVNIIVIITRSYAALRAADLDWIVGPGYSLGQVHSGPGLQGIMVKVLINE